MLYLLDNVVLVRQCCTWHLREVYIIYVQDKKVKVKHKIQENLQTKFTFESICRIFNKYNFWRSFKLSSYPVVSWNFLEMEFIIFQNVAILYRAQTVLQLYCNMITKFIILTTTLIIICHDNYTGYHDNYTGYHDNYTGNHDNYTGYHDNYAGYHNNFTGRTILVVWCIYSVYLQSVQQAALLDSWITLQTVWNPD